MNSSPAVWGSSPAPLSHTAIDTVVGVRTGAEGVAFSPDGTLAYVGNRQSVSVIDTDPTSAAYNTVIATVPIGGWSDQQGGSGVDVSPNGSAYVVHVSNSRVSVISLVPTTPGV